ncbi:unnamed protein product [Rotaria socialis]|nr:unnamed protein product [Rotaria socialis]CAF3420850.1 unnamed protein product [Rotaria socialis]CAF3656469.1 unnamed protein product [Rotaria socialis]CAF4406924.1 unnamed protein product [Rotaria socialis]CAF4438536.1 unnamed protein product [Rotaria socialis]
MLFCWCLPPKDDDKEDIMKDVIVKNEAIGSHNLTQLLASSEIYDSSLNQWTATGRIVTVREYHTATLLNSGKVLVAAGMSLAGYLTSCKVYDPSTGQWSVLASMTTARASHAAILLDSGKILVTGDEG